MVAIMKRFVLLCIYIALSAHPACSQPEPIVTVDNITIAHEHKGWRVIDVSTTPIHFNLIKGDLIVRIGGKNAAETGPMVMASLFNHGDRQQVNLFIERGDFRMETRLREISAMDYEPINADPFKHVASGFSAPDAEFNDLDKQPLTLEQFKGKWLLIDFMATWCAPCIETLPQVLSVADHHKLSLLIVALNDKPGAVRRMQQTYKIGLPIAMMQATAQLPVDFGIMTNLWTGQVPGLVLIRPDGDVALISVGAGDADHIEKTIDCLMNCKASEELK
ncbi:MAG: TlpA disulfide reductase family protein [Terracidiphilus sp.]|jgi:thiol-disulfide isomerase/thioredoxin